VGTREDLELVRRCAAGDQAAWDQFILRTRSAIHRGAGVALRKFRSADPDTLETVLQQVYVELLREDGKTLRTFRGTSDLEGWVAIIAMRTAIHLMRRRGPEGPLPEILPPAQTPAPGEGAERKEFLGRLDGAFRRLSAGERRILQLAYFEERSYREIASELGIPLNSVSPTLIRAKDRLRGLLE
jgi:RNA polymerase sigma-70 factor (ECF subfamily)